MKKRRIFSAALAVCLCVSAAPTVYAQGSPPQTINEEVSDTGPAARADRDETGAVSPLTYDNVYKAMYALKDTYPEGLYWTNYAPYGNKGDKGDFYRWHGGRLEGNVTGGVGCAAFAFILSDEAFGNMPGRIVRNYTYDDIRPGVILRVDNGRHFVIVLQKSAGGVVIAEGNYNKSVHWGRALSKDEVMGESTTFIVTRYPTNYIPPDASDANTVKHTGTEESLNWTLTKAGTLTISGSGTIPDYSPNDNHLPSWNKYNDEINTIAIESGVTSIGNYAFYQSNALSVYLPSGITKIGNSAFRESNIVSVTLPSTVKTIGDDVFRECGTLTSASIPDGLTTIGQRAFHSCTQLQYIDFPASVTKVGAGAFTSCSEMVRARFAPSQEVVDVGDGLFFQCWHLSDLTLPIKINRISNYMLESCTSLTSIYIPADVTEIGENPFVSTGIQHGGTISFGGSEAVWKSKGGQFILNAMPYTRIVYNVPFDDPFAKEDDIPDMIDHIWATEWTHSSSHHWHECTIEDCIMENAAEKGGYAEHSFEGNTCTICQYTKDGSPSHTHSWAAEWTHNDTHHWHKCTIDGCDIENAENNSGYEEHNFGEGEPGSGRTCECGYSERVTLEPEHKHQWDTDWKTNETCHWHECLAEDCTAAANSEKEGHGDHDFSEDNGNTCSICKYKKSSGTQTPGSNPGSSSSGSPSPGYTNPGSSSSGSPNPVTTAPNQPATVTETTTRPDGTQVTVETTTGTDGSETQKITEVKTDGSTTETTTTTNADGSKTETSAITNVDGSKIETTANTNTDGSRLETSVETAADGTVTKETVTDVAADGSSTKTEDTKVTNTKGTQVTINTVTKTDSTGKVTDVTEKSTLAPDSSVTATVTVKKDGDGNVAEAEASVTNTLSSGSKATLQGSVVSQLTEAAGQEDLVVNMTVKDADGKTAYKVKANAADLTARKNLYIYAYNQKTDTYTMVNAKTYKADSAGSLSISMKDNKTYELVDYAAAKEINKQIRATVQVKKSSATIKKGKKTTIALKSTLNKNNIKKITYSTSKKSVATVSKTGKVTAKKDGVATIRAKVTLKNGSTKTVRMKVTVKPGKK